MICYIMTNTTSLLTAVAMTILTIICANKRNAHYKILKLLKSCRFVQIDLFSCTSVSLSWVYSVWAVGRCLWAFCVRLASLLQTEHEENNVKWHILFFKKLELHTSGLLFSRLNWILFITRGWPQMPQNNEILHKFNDETELLLKWTPKSITSELNMCVCKVRNVKRALIIPYRGLETVLRGHALGECPFFCLTSYKKVLF